MLNNKVVVITGGAGLIGKEFLKAVVENQGIAIIADINEELGLKVKESIKIKAIKYVAIGGLANEWISYILTKDQYINGGGYESSVSFYGPDLGEIISEEVIKTAKSITN